MRRGPKRLVAVIAVGLALLVCADPALAGDWERYANPRFGTSAEIPGDGFAPDPAPENGDGQGWTSTDGKGQILVFGAFVLVDETFGGYRDFELSTAREDGLDVTYSAGGKNWYAFSGTKGGDIIYEKAVLSNACSTPIANHIYLKYPASQRARYDPIVQRMAKSLRGGRAGACE
jgi:hypothetical protein